MATKVYWLSAVPARCEVCATTPLTNVFYDMKMKMGPWACMCEKCAMNGAGVGKLGTGYGQKYELKASKWEKTAG